MKRIIALTLALLTFTSLPAQAVSWFGTGTTLHRAPFCGRWDSLTTEGYFAPSLDFASVEAVYDAGHLICQHCYAEIPPAESIENVWYYNPDGGVYYHRDPECPSVSQKYQPLSGVITANNPDWQPESICNFCGGGVAPPSSAADTQVWNAFADEKSRILPGVWTLPSENAISQADAYTIAREHIAAHLSDKVYTVSPMHYDHAYDVGDPRETWKAMVTTALRKPVGLIYIDALTGEVYLTILVEEYAASYAAD